MPFNLHPSQPVIDTLDDDYSEALSSLLQSNSMGDDAIDHTAQGFDFALSLGD
jgi:hypothetical protein